MDQAVEELCHAFLQLGLDMRQQAVFHSSPRWNLSLSTSSSVMDTNNGGRKIQSDIKIKHDYESMGPQTTTAVAATTDYTRFV